MPRVIETKIEICAPPEKVWEVLIDFTRYPEWNPFVKTVEGDFLEGVALKVYLEPPEGKPMAFNPTITKIEPAKRFVWLGRVLFPGLFDGEHRFEIETLNKNCVIFHHSESFSGLLSSLILKLVSQSTEAGFHAMNTALKQRVEDKCNEKH
ncbi:MAG: SRPBCC family protein [Gammaproteobacteria bacterium]